MLFKDLEPGFQFSSNGIEYVKTKNYHTVNSYALKTGKSSYFEDSDFIYLIDSFISYNKSSKFSSLEKNQCFIYNNLLYRKYDEHRARIGDTNSFEGFHTNDIVLMQSAVKMKLEYIASIIEASSTSTILTLKCQSDFGYIVTFNIPTPKEYINIKDKFKINIEQL